jgi:hypothetical protein
MGRVVGSKSGEEVVCPSLAIAQELGADAEHPLDHARPDRMVVELDLGSENVRRPDWTLDDRD